MNQKEKKSIGKGLQMQIMAWALVAGIIILIGGSFAWYTLKERKAESKQAEVMKPYYLTLLNPSETDFLQLSVGSLMPGRIKQIVFCVSNKNNEENTQINMGGSNFDYSMELIYTENVALKYEIYKLSKAEPQGEGIIIAEDRVVVDGMPGIKTTYWKKESQTPLIGRNISDDRHDQVGLNGNVVNRGKYISYEKTETIDNQLHLTAGESGYDSQYFVMEIMWDENEENNFEKYEKETDMIYILVKALQPEPKKRQQTP